jgi:hypothetical protein
MNESIGSATMRDDRTIVLRLRAEDPQSGTIGDGLIEYPPGHPRYAETLAHVGGLEPGQSKPCPPWPDKPT